MLYIVIKLAPNFFYKISFSVDIHNPSFPHKLKNGYNKLECYSSPSWKGLTCTNTLAY